MSLFNKVSLQEKVDFTKSLSIMLKSGITINQALFDLSNQTNSKYFASIIDSIRLSVEGGTSLSEAFGKQEKIFGSIFISLIRAGENSGTLQGNLQFLADWLNRSADLKREVAAATMYPKLVFGAAFLLGGGLSVFILPKLIPLFTSLNVELPLVTKILLAISLIIQNYWFFVILGIVLFILFISYLNKIYKVKRIFHTVYINAPFIGGMLKDYQRALIMQLFATLIKSGLTLNESIKIVAGASTNIKYQESLSKIHSNILKGDSLSNSMTAYGNLFPSMMIGVISVGEKSGTLVQSFEYMAEFYEKEVNIQTKKLPTIIEPLLLVLIAVIVGFVALAIVTPIYELTGSI